MKLANKGRQKILTSLMSNENIGLNGVQDFVILLKGKNRNIEIYNFSYLRNILCFTRQKNNKYGII